MIEIHDVDFLNATYFIQNHFVQVDHWGNENCAVAEQLYAQMMGWA